MRPDDVLSGGGLIIDALFLVVGDERAVVVAALHQQPDTPGGLSCRTALDSFTGAVQASGWHSIKPNLRARRFVGNLLHCGTVQIGDNALQAQILADIGFQNDLLALLHDAVGVRGYHEERGWSPAPLASSSAALALQISS